MRDYLLHPGGRTLAGRSGRRRRRSNLRAEANLADERFTVAGLYLLAATVNGSDAEFRLLEDIAAHRQGPLAEISRLIAIGSRTKDAKTLLAGGELAATLELDAVEARCMALAVDFARQDGDPRPPGQPRPGWTSWLPPSPTCPSCPAAAARC